jgi:excisionase family DNA binding protein
MERLRDDRWLAETLGVGLRTVGRWKAEGTGPAFVRIGQRSARYREEDVEQWLLERRSKIAA